MTFDSKQRLITKLREHDLGTFEHSRRVAEITYDFGVYLGYDKGDLKLLHESAALHDIGKLNIDSDILNSKDKLKDEEFAEILKHTIYSESILREIDMPNKILQAVRSHHENYNGTGYPDELSSDNINTDASIIRIVDSYDSMVNDRSYKKAMSQEDALKEILELKEVFYNPNLVDKFIEYMSAKTAVH